MMSLVTIIPEQPIFAAGSGSEVKVYDGQTNQLHWGVDAFPGRPGGVTVAVGDVNFDGIDDVAVGAGPGGRPRVKVDSGADRSFLFNFRAFPRSFRGGVRVALGDINNDGYKDVIAGAGAGGPPRVRVFSGRDGSLLGSFLAYKASFRGGVFVSAADVDGNGRTNIITGPGAGGAPEGKVLADARQLVSRLMAFGRGFRGGVRVGSGRITGKAFPAVVAGGGVGDPPRVAVFAADFNNPEEGPGSGEIKWITVARFRAYAAEFRGGVYVSSVQTPAGDDVLTGRGFGSRPRVKRFGVVWLRETASFLAFGKRRRGGVRVGG